jgi:hypothetical protein
LNLPRSAYQTCTALTLFSVIAACSGSPLVATPGTDYNAAMISYHRSWMLPGTSSGGDLAYAAGRHGVLYVVTYPQGGLVGEVSLPIFGNSGGICSDGNGDIFVPDVDEIVEYAHGGTEPVATLDDGSGNYKPIGCAVDPTTGNLAVTNYKDSSSGGNVAIYANAQGEPTFYSDSRIPNPFYCGYDNQGNLFIDGGGPFAELPSGSGNFTNITLNRKKTAYGQVQWDGTYVTVTSQNASKIYRLQISGSKGTIIGTTQLKGPGRRATSQSWIQGSTIIAPIGPGQLDSRIGFWNYPSGGKAFTIVNLGSRAEAVGVTVSASQ